MTFRCIVLHLAVLLFSVAGAELQAQEVPLGSEREDYLRLLEIEGEVTGPLHFRSLSSTRYRYQGIDSTQPWFSTYPTLGSSAETPGFQWRLLQPDAGVVVNSHHPFDANNGSLWAGRGLNGYLTFGIQARWGPVTTTLMPTWSASQNENFDTQPVTRSGVSPYSNPWHSGAIDWPQRMGPRGFSTLDPGQSSIRVDLGHFTAAASTENMWWGPAVRYPLLMSNTAAGFPHIDLGIGRPINLGIGSGEIRVVWGELLESQYFDTISTNNRRFVAGLTAALHLRWPPGLTLAFNRVFYQEWANLQAHDWFDIIQPFFKSSLVTAMDTLGEDKRDQILSVSARWIMPESKVQVYFEYARNDHAWNLRDLILEPDHSRAFVIGLERAFTAPHHVIRMTGEWADLAHTPTFQVRDDPDYYVHGVAVQGYTEKGQLLGAWIGPGSNAQYLAVDRFDSHGRLGGYLERVLYDNDAYYSVAARTETFWGHEVDLALGLSGVRFVGAFDLGANLQIRRRLNWYFRRDVDVTNLVLGFSIGRRNAPGKH